MSFNLCTVKTVSLQFVADVIVTRMRNGSSDLEVLVELRKLQEVLGEVQNNREYKADGCPFSFFYSFFFLFWLVLCTLRAHKVTTYNTSDTR